MDTVKAVKDRRILLDEVGVKDRACAEIGVCHGSYSNEIYARRPSRLLLIDPWALKGHRLPGVSDTLRDGKGDNGFLAVRLLFRSAPNVTIIRKTSFEAAQDVSERSLDFVFIDGDHTFHFSLADLYLWYPKLKKGGCLACHDYLSPNHPGVTEAVNAFLSVSGEQISFVTQDNPKSCALIKTH